MIIQESTDIAMVTCSGSISSKADYAPHTVMAVSLMRPAGLELATFGLGNRRSILLSYGRSISNSFHYNHFSIMPSITFIP